MENDDNNPIYEVEHKMNMFLLDLYEESGFSISSKNRNLIVEKTKELSIWFQHHPKHNKKKNELTVEKAIEQKMTPIDLVKHFKPEWTDAQCDVYLWENTCFPFSTEMMIKQLNKNLV